LSEIYFKNNKTSQRKNLKSLNFNSSERKNKNSSMAVTKVLSKMNSVRRCHVGKKQKCNSKNKLMKSLRRKIKRRKGLKRRRIIRRSLVMLKNKLKL